MRNEKYQLPKCYNCKFGKNQGNTLVFCEKPIPQGLDAGTRLNLTVFCLNNTCNFHIFKTK